MKATTLGKLMVNDVLPEALRGEDVSFAGDSGEMLLRRLAEEYPDKYREVSSKLVQLGGEAAFTEGVTIRLRDLTDPSNRPSMLKYIEQQERVINRSDATLEDKAEARGLLYAEIQKGLVDDTYAKALSTDNPLALQVLTKARGNPLQLSGVLSSPGNFKDAKGRPMPLFVRHSYSEGLTPAEYYTATFGTRTGVVSMKLATRDAGDVGKQFATAAMDLIVTSDDCGTLNGIPAPVDDQDNVGSLLAKDVGGYKAGTPITAKMIKEMKEGGFERILVRSPITCQAEGGICKRCVGLRESGKLPNLRDHVGLQASSALAERIAQSALNVRHTGGQKEKGVEYSGFPVIEQLGSIPATFQHGAAVAEEDGQVGKIEPAPQGGTNIHIGDRVHYVLPELEASVKTGDMVEAGDQLSTGILNPAQVVQHKGIGEGRRYFAERLTKAFRDSKLSVNRRNAEVLARAVINHVNVEEPEGLGDWLPGDTVPYNAMAFSYVPRKDAKEIRVKDAAGQYLEQPALHYSIGTRVTGKVAKELQGFGVDKVMAHPAMPGFVPEMIRLRAVPHYGTDWMGKLKGSYLQSVLMGSAQSGEKSNIHGTNPIPGIAYGVEFGQSKPKAVTF